MNLMPRGKSRQIRGVYLLQRTISDNGSRLFRARSLGELGFKNQNIAVSLKVEMDAAKIITQPTFSATHTQ